jgi:hypothetical protein
MKAYVDRQKKNEDRRRQMYDILDKQSPGWAEPYHATLRRPLTEKDRKQLQVFQEQINALPPEDEYIPEYDD